MSDSPRRRGASPSCPLFRFKKIAQEELAGPPHAVQHFQEFDTMKFARDVDESAAKVVSHGFHLTRERHPVIRCEEQCSHAVDAEKVDVWNREVGLTSTALTLLLRNSFRSWMSSLVISASQIKLKPMQMLSRPQNVFNRRDQRKENDHASSVQSLPGLA